MAKNYLNIILLVFSVLSVMYHAVAVHFLFFDPLMHQNIHLMLAFIIVFLIIIIEEKKAINKFIWAFLLINAVIATMYININFYELTLRRGGPTSMDLYIGSAIIILAIIGTTKRWGAAVPVVALIFTIYAFTNSYWPGVLAGHSLSFERYVTMVCIGLTGMYGTFLGVSANFIYLFLVFGVALDVTKGTDWFKNLGIIASRKSRAGAAQCSVISSAAVSMVTGSAVANVGITGAFTIPLMKNSGYRAQTAGAIEAVASSAGQITPPVMGASAFVMAEILGIPYASVMLYAIIPAILYYISIFIYLEMWAKKENIAHSDIPFNSHVFYYYLPLIVIPLTILIYLLVTGRSPSYSAFWGIASILIISLIQSETRLSMKDVSKFFLRGARLGSEMAVIIAALAPIWVTLTATGMGIKLPRLVEMASGGNLFVAMFMVMITSMVLGMVVPTIGAYLLVALTTAPALALLGVEPVAAHFAALYFAVFSAITPPVAQAAFVSSRIADSSAWRTSVEAFKIGGIALIIPFLFMYNNKLMGIGVTWNIPLILIATVIGLICWNMMLVGFIKRKLYLWERALAFLAALSCFYYIVIENIYILLVGILFTLSLLALQRYGKK